MALNFQVTAPLATLSAGDTTFKWFEFDVTSFVQNKLSSGAVSFVLEVSPKANSTFDINSKEASTNKPELVIVAGTGGGGVTYTVTYDGNGNTGGNIPAGANYQQGDTVTVSGNTGNLAKTGYTFAGWNTQADGNGTTYQPNATFVMGTANVTLYAQWTTNPTYTVTYDGNGNTGGNIPAGANYQQGDTVTVSGNTGSLTKTGYTFAGWNTQADGSGTTYQPNATFVMGTANVTLYAQWTAAPTYTVTYNGNGNTGGNAPASANYHQGDIVTVSGNTGSLTKTGYTFAGWNTQAGGGGNTYQPGATFAMGTANVTLYAQWTSADFLNMNFQNYTGGMYPPGTSSIQTDPFWVWSDQTTYTYTSAQGPGKEPSNVCMKIEGTSSAGWKYPWRLFATPASMTGTWEMSGEIYMGENNTLRRDLFMLGYDTTSPQYFVTLEFRPDNYVYYQNGSSLATKSTTTYSPNKWYKVRVTVDFGAGTYSSYLTNLTDDPGNEITIAANKDLRPDTQFKRFVTRIETTAAAQNSVTYFDNLKISEQ